MNFFILLGPLSLWGAIELVGSEDFGLFAVFWWFLHLFLFRDRATARLSGFWAGLRRAAPTWIPVGTTWVILPAASHWEWFPWDRQMAVAVVAFPSVLWQSKRLPDCGDWIRYPRVLLGLVVLLWLPFHIVRPLYELLNFKGTIDLMIFHSIAANLIEGNGLLVSYFHPAKNFLEGHFSPILYLALAPYALFRSVAYLVGLQAFVLAGAGITLYGLALTATKNRTFALALALSFLLHPMLQAVQYAWFHEVSLGPVLFFGLAWLWISKIKFDNEGIGSEMAPASLRPDGSLLLSLKRLPFLGFLVLWILILSVKEDASVVLVLVGAAMILSDPKNQRVWIVTGVSVVWVLWLMLWYLPSQGVGGKYTYFDRVAYQFDPSAGPISNLKGLYRFIVDRLFRADKLRYVFHMGIPLGFLWIRAGWWLLPAAPIFAWIALSQNWLEYAFYPCQYPVLPLTTLYLAAVWAGFCLTRSKSAQSVQRLNRWAYVVLLSGLSFHCLLSNARIYQWVRPVVWSNMTLVSEDAIGLYDNLGGLSEDATVWCDSSHGHFVNNPAMCKMLPWELTDAEPISGKKLYVVLKNKPEEYNDWAREILENPTDSPGWRLVYANPLGSIFEWTMQGNP